MASKIAVQRQKPAHHRNLDHAKTSKSSTRSSVPAHRLQQEIGNAATMRVFRGGVIQPKLTVSHPEDEYEREADRVADEVMRMPEPQSGLAIQRSPLKLQRVCCEDEIQRRAGRASHARVGEEGDGIGGGNLSHVRLHTDSRAGWAANKISAQSCCGGANTYLAPAPSDVRPTAVSALDIVQTGGRSLEKPGWRAMESRFQRDLGSQARPGLASLQSAVGDRALSRLLRSTPRDLGTASQFGPAGALIQRQPNPNVRPPTGQDRREFIQDTIDFFNKSAAFFGDRSVTMDRTIFDRVITSSYSSVVRQEQMIDADLMGDAALKRRLRAAYTTAIRVLMTRAAATLRKTEDDLYRENSGRIPMWAWQTPHHMEPGISTPIGPGRSVNPRGNVRFATNGFDVTIVPDRVVPRLRKAAVTEHAIAFGRITSLYQRTGQRLITRFNLATPTVQIQTTFRRGVTAASPSGYGRGTTAEDVAGGTITPRSTALGFHEGSHGLDFVQFIEHNPPPQFAGAVGMTKVAFEAEITNWHRAWSDYANALAAFSTRHGDCVGTTIDQFNRAGSGRGARVVLECGP